MILKRIKAFEIADRDGFGADEILIKRFNADGHIDQRWNFIGCLAIMEQLGLVPTR